MGAKSERALSRRRVLFATTAFVAVAGFGAAAHAATPIDTGAPFYLQSNVGGTVLPDFQGGTLRDNVNAVTDTHAYNVENFPTNTIDEFGNTVTFTGTFSGAGPLTFVDSVGGGNAIFTGTSVLGGAVTIDPNATLTWGNGTGGAFLIGPGNGVVDNGALVMDFGGASGVVGEVPISGTGSVTVHSGLFEELGPATYTGGTTIDAAGTLTLGNGGSSVGTLVGAITDNGALKFDYAGAPPVTADNSISGAGSVEFVSGTTVITGASAVGGTVTIDSGAISQWGDGTAGAFLVGGGNVVTDNGALVMNFNVGGGIVGSAPIGGTGTLEIQQGLFEETGAITITGATTVDSGGTLELGGGGATGTVAGAIVDNGLVQFNHSGTVTLSSAGISGSGSVELVAGTLVDANTDAVGGTVTIDTGATLQWGNGTGGAFLIGAGNAVTDNGALVMDFGGASGVIGEIPISGTGSVTVHSGLFEELGAATYTGGTTIDAAGTLILGNGGGGSVGALVGGITDNGLLKFDYAGAAPVTADNSISGAGSAEFVSGTTVITNTSAVGGTVTIDSGATAQWGDGTSGAFLVGGGNAVTDNGALVMDFNAGGAIVGSVPIGGTGTVEVQQGLFEETGVSTYSGTTTIDAAGTLALNGAGSISNSGGVIDNGAFDISTTTAGTSITTLSGSGGVSLGAKTLTLTNASGTFAGVLSDGGAGGGLTIQLGTETLTGTNTFTGTTTIDLGATLALGNGGATGSVAGPINDNGLLQFNYSGPVTTAGAISGGGSAEVVAGTAVMTNFDFVGGTVTIDPGATLQWGDGAPALLTGGTGVVDNGALVMNFGGGGIGATIPISGTGTVEIQSGSLNNAGVSTYTGTTTIDPGAFLALSGGGSISNSSDVTDNGFFDISGTTAGTSITTLDGSGFVQLGAQTLTLTAASGTFSGSMVDGGIAGGAGGGLTIGAGAETLTGANTFTGATTINPGATLALGDGVSNGTVAGAVVDNGLVQFNYNGSATIPGAFSGTGSVEAVAGTAVVTNASFVGGNVTIDSGATMQWGAGGPAFLVGGGNAVIDNGALMMNFGGGGIAGAIPISGSGTVELQSGALNDSAVSTYTGTTTIDPAGFLLLTGGGSISNSSDVIDNGTFDISGEPAGTSITTLEGSGGVSLGAQTLTLTNASGTFSGVLADGGAFGGVGGGLTIAGGTETLTGVNTFTGLTAILDGATLNLVGAGSIADSDPLVNGTFDISGASPPGSSITSLSGHGHVILGANTLTLTAASDLFSGFISGTGGLTIGAGTEALSGINTFTGTTLIDPGATLQLGDGAGTMGLLAGPITDNGHLHFNGGPATFSIFFTSITGTGDAELVSGTLVLGGTNTYTGATTIDLGSTLQLGNGGATGSVAGDIVDNGLLLFDYASTAAVTIPGDISGTGSAELLSGTLVLTGAGAIDGTVTIDAGSTMQWGAGNPAFLVGATGVIDNGALVMDFGGGGVGTTAAISGTGSVRLHTGSFNTLGVNTYTGPTTIDSGGLFLLSGSGSIADSSDVTVNGTFDISGTTAGASITTLDGSGQVSLGGERLTLTSASGLFSGVMADGGIFGGTGGQLLIGAGSETLTGTNTFTGVTGVAPGATLQLGNGGLTGTLASGHVVDNGLVLFDYSGPVTTPNDFVGSGSAVVESGTIVVTGAGVIGGTVTIDPGATMRWGDGSGVGFLAGGSGIIDNGAFVLDIDGGGISTSSPFSGVGTVLIHTGALTLGGVNTYTGVTTIDTGAALRLSGAGSIADSANVIDNGHFDIFGTTAGASIVSLTGAGSVFLGAQTLTLTNAFGTFSGVLADGLGGTGGGLTIAHGTETLTGTNTFTGTTTINTGATLRLGNGGTTGTVAGPVVDNGLVFFNYGGPVVSGNAFTGAGSAEVQAGTLVVTNVSVLGGTVTVDPGATLQWGNGGTGFLGGGGGTIDNGAIVARLGAGGVSTTSPISGSGSLTVQSGSLNLLGVNTYTGPTTINLGGLLALTGSGSIANSSSLLDNGVFDISGTTSGTSIRTLSGGGVVQLGGKTLTLTNAADTFAGVLVDGGLAGGTGGGLTIAGGAETLTGNSTFTGNTTINTGTTLQLGNGADTGFVSGPIVDNGTLVFDRNNLAVFTHSISGTGVMNQIGTGTTILDAVNPISGLTTISAGVLEVGDASHPSATLGGNVVVGAHGTLMGHGLIAGSVNNTAGGVVAPGGTIGTLTVGSYTQGATSTLAIEVSPAAASQLNSLGPASLNGILALTFDPGTYSARIYDILNGNPVTGTFSTVTTAGTVGPGNLFGIFYTGTQVDLVTEATTNAQIYGGVSAATLDRAGNFASVVEDRFGDAGCPDGSADRSAPGCSGYGAWAFVIGSWNDHGSEGSLLGYHNDGVGVVAGLDRSTDNGSLVGAAFGYVHNDLAMPADTAKATGPSYYGAVYGRLVDGRNWFDGEVFYMHTGWSVERGIPGIGVATARPNTDSEGFLLQASTEIGDTGLRPYGRFTYVLSRRAGLIEGGVGPLGFAVASQTQSAAVGEIGVLYAPVFTTGGGMVVRPSVRLGVQDNAGDQSQTVDGSLFGITGTAFSQAAPRLWGVAGVVDGALKMRVNQNLELFGDVTGRFGSHQTDAVASGGVVVRF